MTRVEECFRMLYEMSEKSQVRTSVVVANNMQSFEVTMQRGFSFLSMTIHEHDLPYFEVIMAQQLKAVLGVEL
jgi:hypothetical protein